MSTQVSVLLFKLLVQGKLLVILVPNGLKLDLFVAVLINLSL